jgi:hypothetical protein
MASTTARWLTAWLGLALDLASLFLPGAALGVASVSDGLAAVLD